MASVSAVTPGINAAPELSIGSKPET